MVICIIKIDNTNNIKNITKTTKTILFASLLVAMILPFSTMDFAFADVSPEIKEEAKKGHDAWKELKAEKKKVKKDSKKIDKLEKKFQKYVKELNKHGIATQEQWDKNSQYWRNMNMPSISEPIIENDNTHNTMLGVDSFSNVGNSEIELMSHGCGSCTSQKLYVIAGFDYLLWGFWPTTAYADAGWKTLTYDGQERTSFVTTEDDHDEITPHISQKIQKSGTVNYDYGYDARAGGSLLDANNSYGINAIQVAPNSLSITEDELSNVVDGTTISYTVEVNWLQ